jgi:hypothetical protein
VPVKEEKRAYALPPLPARIKILTEHYRLTQYNKYLSKGKSYQTAVVHLNNIGTSCCVCAYYGIKMKLTNAIFNVLRVVCTA